MGAEAWCHASAKRRSHAAVVAALAAANARWAPRGLRVAGRWHADRAEDRDEPLDEDGRGVVGFPLICFVLPPAAAAVPVALPVGAYAAPPPPPPVSAAAAAYQGASAPAMPVVAAALGGGKGAATAAAGLAPWAASVLPRIDEDPY